MTGPVVAEVLRPAQEALYARLRGDEALRDLLAAPGGPRGLHGVYDGAPEGAPYPYVVLGEAVETPRNAHGAFGAEVLADVHVWDQARTFSTAQRVAGRVRALLDHQPLAVAGHVVVSVRHEQTQTLRDPDPELRHLLVRIRITTEQE